MSACSIESLPPEVIRNIIEYLVPRGLSFKFLEHGGNLPRSLKWSVEARGMDGKGYYKAVLDRTPHYDTLADVFKAPNPIATLLKTYTCLLRLKRFAKDARAVFFTNNEICITIANFGPSTIFGPFAVDTHNTHAIREIRNLRILFHLSRDDGGVYRSLRSRLRSLVSELARHAEDKDNMSLLKRLRVGVEGYWTPLTHVICHGENLTRRSYSGRVTLMHLTKYRQVNDPDPISMGHQMFVLEVLLQLRPALKIKDVKISGVLGSFARCLEMCLRGEGGELSRIESTRSWGQPIFDWRVFAARNGIDISHRPTAHNGTYIFPDYERGNRSF
ncbi:hypothetical protein NX059_011534 [Plenodomus lindquistii]|nr:hypothetical protein NX059_011534 [Plenodomus lindquistii]